jgi:hypothetical protein
MKIMLICCVNLAYVLVFLIHEHAFEQLYLMASMATAPLEKKALVILAV